MILFTIFLLIISFLTGYYFKYLQIDKHHNKIIAGLHNEPLSKLIKGEVDFAFNGDIKICYELIKSDKADAEYIILLHGLTRTMLAYSNDFMQPFLDAGYHVIRIDNRDSGLSTWVKDWENGNKYSLEDMAADAVAVANQLQIKQFHLAGKSMGGMIAQCMAIQHPERVKTLTSIMSTGFFHNPELVQVPRKFKFKFALIYITYYRSLKKLEG